MKFQYIPPIIYKILGIKNVAGVQINPATEETLSTIADAVLPGSASHDSPSIVTQPKLVESWSWSFADEVASGVDTSKGTVIKLGAGQSVSQTGGSLFINAQTTPYAETIIRGLQPLVGSFNLEYAIQMNQRIAFNNIAIELVDIIGDNISFSNQSATRIDVTLPSHGFTSKDLSKTIWIGAITGMDAIAQQATIQAIVNSNTVRLAVSGFPGLGGTGTCSLFGMNYHQVIYSGTSATAHGTGYGVSRQGRATPWASGSTLSTTTGNISVIENIMPGRSSFIDLPTTSNQGTELSQRVSRVQNVPEDDVPLYFQIRVFNGISAPASNTSVNIGMVRWEKKTYMPTQIGSIGVLPNRNALPIQIQGGGVSQTATAAALGTAGLGAWTVRGGAVRIGDIGSGAITSTATSGGISLVDIVGSHQFHVDATAVTGTNTFMRTRVQATNDGGTNFVLNIWDFPRVTNATDKTHTSPVLPVEFANMRYVRTIGGTTPSVTNSVTRTVRAGGEAKRMRQLNDIELSLTAVAGSTNYLYTAGCTKVQMMCTPLTGMTAPPVLKLQGCHGDPADNSDWFDIPSATLSPSITTTVASAIYDIPACKFLRYSVTTGGTGTVTALYDLLITSWES